MMRYLLPNNVFGVGISRAALSRTRTIRVPIVKLRMMKNREDEEEGHGIQNKVGANPRGVDRLQQVLHSASDADGTQMFIWFFKMSALMGFAIFARNFYVFLMFIYTVYNPAENKRIFSFYYLIGKSPIEIRL